MPALRRRFFSIMRDNMLEVKRAFVFLSAIFLFLNTACAEDKSIEEHLKVDSTTTAVLLIVGDLMCHAQQFKDAQITKDSFDFKSVYRLVKPYIESADFAIGNLETVTAGSAKNFAGYPAFNSPDEYVEAVSYAGFDFLFTSNNHSYDRGEFGLLRTIEIVDKNNIGRTGTYKSVEDRDSIRIADINGIKIALLSYTYGLNGHILPKGKDYFVNLIDEELIKKDILKAKSNDNDLILVYFHYGDEYKRYPNKAQTHMVDKAFEFGADIVIGGHPHVLQPVDFRKGQNSKMDSVFVAYSMGNFLSNQRKRYQDAGIILNIEIEKNIFSDSVYIKSVSYVPTWVFAGNTEKGKEFIIIPSQRAINGEYDFLTKENLRRIKESFEDTIEIIESYTKRIKLFE